MVIAVNGTLLDAGRARRLKESGISRVSMSIDGPPGKPRQVQGRGRLLRCGDERAEMLRQGLPFQINTT